MAHAAGMHDGDTLASLDGLPVCSAAELQVALRSAGREARVTMRFERAGEELEKSVPALHAATEDGVLYDAVEREEGVRLRTMLDRPAGSGRRPALLFVQGLSVATMDFAFPDLFRALRDEGFVTMRLEKRGVGDSEGDAPERGDFMTEVADVRAALEALARYDFVDPEAVFVFGHSVGGMIAPLLGDRARGIIAYGSSAEPWFECLEASARRQSTLRGAPDVDACVLAAREELLTQPVIDGRAAAYHRQLHEAAIAAAWSRVRTPVLVLHGEYDWVVGEDEGQRIAQLARGTFRSLPRVDHLFTAHDSLEESLQSYGKGRFDPEIVRETCAWMRVASRVGSP